MKNTSLMGVDNKISEIPPSGDTRHLHSLSYSAQSCVSETSVFVSRVKILYLYCRLSVQNQLVTCIVVENALVFTLYRFNHNKGVI